MAELPDQVAKAYIRGFKSIVDYVDPHDLVHELVERRILPLSYVEQHRCERRRVAMMKLLGKIHRQSLVDRITYGEFVDALEHVNTRDPGHKYEEIIKEIRPTIMAGNGIVSADTSSCEYVPFCEVERRVFECTRKVAERSLEPESILPDLVNSGAISIENCLESLEMKSRVEQVHHLMDTIIKRGSRALDSFVQILIGSEDRGVNGVGQIIKECLEAHRESPYTHSEWLDHDVGKRESVECVAFRCAYSDAFACISTSDPQLTIVNLLYSSGMVDRATRDDATDPRKQSMDNVRYLLAQLERHIEKCPEFYHKTVALLEQADSCYLNQLAMLWKTSFEKQVEKDNRSTTDITLTEIEEGDSYQLSYEMNSYREELQSISSRESGLELIQEKWPGKFLSCIIPTNLAKITREKVYRSTADAFTQATLHGNIDEIDKSKSPIVKESLFEGDHRCIVAQGAAGIGKSTFAQELAHDWAIGKSSMRTFNLACLVPLRSSSLHKVTTVFDLFSPKPSEAVQREIESRKGEGLLLILDGFDELPASAHKGNSLYSRLISGLELSKARILITTRPKTVKVIEQMTETKSRKILNIEILGFQMRDIESCVEHMLPDEAQQRVFLKYIEENVVIKNMMYIPLHTVIVIELFRQKLASSGELDTKRCAMTLTELFRELCKCLVYRHIASMNPNTLPAFDDVQLDNLPESQAQETFETLCAYAFDSLSQQNMIFDTLPETFDHMGFMKSILVQTRGLFSQPHLSLSFHHLTIHEFLTAFHLWRTREPLEQLDMVKKLPTDHQNMVLRFLAGLSQFREVGWSQAMESVGICFDSQGNRGCNSTLLNCLFEAQDPAICQEIFPSGHIINYSPMTTTQFDCFALGYCIAHSGEGCTWKLCAIGGRDIGAIAAGISASKEGHPTGRIDLVKMSYGGEEIHNLGLLPECVVREIRELNLSNCGLNDNAALWLANFLPFMPSLRQLDLGDNPFTGGSAGKIFIALSQLASFQYLDLLHAQLDKSDIDSLRTLVKKNGTLKNLIIGRCQMQPSLVEKMVDVVLGQHSCLESISFMNIDFPRLATHLARRLAVNTTLESIMFWDRSFCTDGAVELLRSLESNRKLLSMTLMPWYKKNIPEHILSHPSIKSRVQWFIYPTRKKT